ncbi:Ig-like domain-containing protein [Bacillus luteolus]|uniref:Ig-like domain-containing protein n=2 Tax=Litchfieldia luteola TaxID=682179 RepID=A0ABR9QF27_9BACI|nr:Ig-like domain-containing protein [Cytobacillus luteolus]MBP1943427.1 hypothetical protein [Cytobacillus luteolus]
MKRSIVYKIVFIVPIGLLLGLVLYSPSTLSLTEDQLPSQVTSNPNKEWTVSFNMAVSPATVSANTIYIVDENNKKIPSKLLVGKDGLSVTVTPRTSYIEGAQYYLIVDDALRSTKKLFLWADTVMPFKYKKSNATSTRAKEQAGEDKKPAAAISSISVKSKHFTYLSEFTVQTTNNSIVKIIIEGSEMQYEGNNTFTANLAGIKSGDKLSIKGYNSENKVVERLSYDVE